MVFPLLIFSQQKKLGEGFFMNIIWSAKKIFIFILLKKLP